MENLEYMKLCLIHFIMGKYDGMMKYTKGNTRRSFQKSSLKSYNKNSLDQQTTHNTETNIARESGTLVEGGAWTGKGSKEKKYHRREDE